MNELILLKAKKWPEYSNSKLINNYNRPNINALNKRNKLISAKEQ